MYHGLNLFENDQPEALECNITGNVPDWIDGCLYRAGPSKIRFGPDQHYHLFDGEALAHKYTIKDGKVKYQNKSLETKSYMMNKAAQRIISGGFSRVSYPDPCKSVFNRYFSYFLGTDEGVDNTLVNVLKLSDQLYYMTETNTLNCVDPDNLSVLHDVKLDHLVSVHFATAHPVQDKDGTVYNVGTQAGRQTFYKIIKVPRPLTGDTKPWQKVTEVGQIPSQFGRDFSYTHSFGMTENYIVYIEQPCVVSLLGIASRKVTRLSFRENMTFRSDAKTRLHVMHKSTGSLISTKYITDPLFVFHHINTYEEDHHLVVDIAGYENADIIQALLLEELAKNKPVPQSVITRFVLPLDINKGQSGNIVTLKDTTATAKLTPDGTVFCTPEQFPDGCCELPRINESYLMKKYRYVYGIFNLQVKFGTKLCKYDLVTRSSKLWECDGYLPGEPVFLQRPGSLEEDDGIILAPVHSYRDDLDSFLLVMDAGSFTELARADVTSPLPMSFHGIFTGPIANQPSPSPKM